MQRILVSLVSDQTIPNILLIRELRNVDRYLFITTPQMEKKEKSACIMKAAEIPEDRTMVIEVAEDSLVDIKKRLEKCDFEDEDEFYVNLTGGTKIMSIGVYNFFRERKSEIYYIPIGKNIYRKIFPEVKNKEFDLGFRIGLKQYLQGYGIEIVNQKDGSGFVAQPDYTEYFFDTWKSPPSGFFDFIDRLREKRGRKSVPLRDIDGLESMLEKIRFKPAGQDRLLKKEIAYLTGGWFEEYIFSQIEKAFHKNPGFIASDVNIRRSDVENEFDVMFMHENTLHVIECKTSIYDKQTKKNIANDSIYKLSALSHDFGLRVPSYLVTLSRKGKQKNHVKDAFIKRAGLLGISIIYGDLLLNAPLSKALNIS